MRALSRKRRPESRRIALNPHDRTRLQLAHDASILGVGELAFQLLANGLLHLIVELQLPGFFALRDADQVYAGRERDYRADLAFAQTEQHILQLGRADFAAPLAQSFAAAQL